MSCEDDPVPPAWVTALLQVCGQRRASAQAGRVTWVSEGRERSEVLGSNGLHWLWATGADWFVTCVFHKELGGQVVSEQALAEHSWLWMCPGWAWACEKGASSVLEMCVPGSGSSLRLLRAVCSAFLSKGWDVRPALPCWVVICFMILALGAVVKIPTQLRSGADISPVCSGSWYQKHKSVFCLLLLLLKG